jgi:hypothetical protein
MRREEEKRKIGVGRWVNGIERTFFVTAWERLCTMVWQL